MTADTRRLLGKLANRPAAEETEIAEAERQAGLRFPPGYVEYLRVANGSEGFIGDAAYVMFWSASELATLNRSYETDKYAPGLLLFGSNGSGEAFAFDTRNHCAIVQIPFVGMAREELQILGESFDAFLELLAGQTE